MLQQIRYQSESSSIENIATEVDVPNALQTQLDTNIDNESLKNYSLDIGLFLSASNNINDAKKYELLKNPWTPPKNYQFPIEQQRRLKFQFDWLIRFPLLVYSEKVPCVNAVYYLPITVLVKGSIKN